MFDGEGINLYMGGKDQLLSPIDGQEGFFLDVLLSSPPHMAEGGLLERNIFAYYDFETLIGNVLFS